MNKKPSMSPHRSRERALFLYASALQTGDFDAVSAVLKLAESDAILDQMLKDFDSLTTVPEAREETSPRPLQNGKGIQQNIIIRHASPNGRPSEFDPSQEDTDMMLYTTFDSSVPENPKTLYPFAVRFVTLAAAILIVALVGGLLIEMVNDPIDGYPALALQTDEPKCAAESVTDATAESVRLAEAANALLETPAKDRTPEMIEQATLLSTCALRTAYTPEADAALLDALMLANHLPSFSGIYGKFSPDGQQILTSTDGNTLMLWDMATGEQIRQFVGHTPDENGNITFAFSPDGRTFASSGGDHTARLWDVATGKEIRQFPGLVTGRYESLTFSPDGKYVLAGFYSFTNAEGHGVLMWDVQTGEEVRRFVGHTQLVFSVGVSPDGHYLATTSFDDTARLWDVATGQEIREFPSYPSWTYGAAFSPDGQFLASGGGADYARLLDVQTGETVREFHTTYSGRVAYSPDGRFILTGGAFAAPQAAVLWDAETGDQRRVFTFPGQAQEVGFSPGGNFIVIGTADDFIVRLWPTTVDDTIALACSKIMRDFTAEERAQYGLGEGTACP